MERENDMLARQLLTSKITMRADLDKLEDLKESLEKVIFVVVEGGGWLVASYRPKLESSNGINVMVIVRDGVAKAEPQQELILKNHY